MQVKMSRRATILIGALASVAVYIRPMAGRADEKAASYFPKEEFHDLESYDVDVPERFSKLLSAANEPIMFNKPTIMFSVRLSVQFGFNNTIVIRVQESSNGAISATYKKLQLIEPSGASALKAQKEIAISHVDVQKLRDLVRETNFWAADNRQELVGSDGSDWVLEVKDGGSYHVSYQYWPSKGAVYELGEALIHLSGARVVDR